MDGDGDIDSGFRQRDFPPKSGVGNAKVIWHHSDSDMDVNAEIQSTAVPESSHVGQSDLVRVVKPVRPPTTPVRVVKATRQPSHAVMLGQESFHEAHSEAYIGGRICD
jgi:hypothetical protein